MKEYRARKKASLGTVWLQMESQRVMKYYVPTADLNKKQKTERRLRIKKNVPNASLHSSTIILEDENSVSSMSNIPVTETLLIVKLPSYRTSGKKRSQRALSIN
ncbi:hypothetical protein SNE40_022770 [Patella caerulea]